jgi:hypothetical protein
MTGVDRDQVAAEVTDARRRWPTSTGFESPWHAGRCTLTRECGPHCGTYPVGGDASGEAATRHCACCCPEALKPVEVPDVRRKTPMCDRWYSPNLDRRAEVLDRARRAAG